MRRRGFLKNLLVSTLDAAISFPKRNAVSVLVREYLGLNMAGCGDVLLNEHDVVTERVEGFGFGGGELVKEDGRGGGNAHSFTTTTLDGFEEDGESNLFGLGQEERGVLVDAVVAGNAGDGGQSHDVFRAAGMTLMGWRGLRTVWEISRPTFCSPLLRLLPMAGR